MSESEALAARRSRFELMFQDHAADVRRFAVRRVGHDAADDVVASTFLAGWLRLDDIPAGHPRAWLFEAAGYVIANEVRSEVRRERLHDRVSRERGDWADLVSDHAERVTDRDFALRVLAQQSASDQEILRLVEWDGLSTEEGALILGCSRSVFRVRLHRARKHFCESARTAAQEPQRSDDRKFPSEKRLVQGTVSE
jgi:RNA polymerase sigma factor (sigma-70 family)